MSAAPKIIEGTWEEISRRSPELAGHRLKVIVLDPQPDPTNVASARPSAEEWVAWLRDWAYNRPPTNSNVDDSRDAIYEDYLR